MTNEVYTLPPLDESLVKYGDLRHGDLFVFPDGESFYMKTDRNCYSSDRPNSLIRTALSLNAGCLYWVEDDKVVRRLPKGIVVCIKQS